MRKRYHQNRNDRKRKQDGHKERHYICTERHEGYHKRSSMKTITKRSGKCCSSVQIVRSSVTITLEGRNFGIETGLKARDYMRKIARQNLTRLTRIRKLASDRPSMIFKKNPSCFIYWRFAGVLIDYYSLEKTYISPG